MANGRSAAEHFRALGHPTRLDIMQVLVAEGEVRVCHLEGRALGLRQAYLSQQLARLRQAGLVVDRREGLNVYYRPASPAIRKLLEAGAHRLETALGAGAEVRRPAGSSAHLGQQPCPCPRCQQARSRGANGVVPVRALGRVAAVPGLIIHYLQGGLGNLAAYLAAHVLLCLVPAFFIAGGLAALIPKESVTRFLGRTAPRFVSYPAAALAGSVLAVCSCTIVPLFAGIYKKGAGIGPAVTFLFFAPAGNILALAYTGVAIGPDLALARLFLSLAFGIGIGMIMALIFRRSDAEHDRQTDDLFAARAAVRRGAMIFLLVLVALLLFGTLKIGLLTDTYARVTLPIGGRRASAGGPLPPRAVRCQPWRGGGDGPGSRPDPSPGLNRFRRLARVRARARGIQPLDRPGARPDRVDPSGGGRGDGAGPRWIDASGYRQVLRRCVGADHSGLVGPVSP